MAGFRPGAHNLQGGSYPDANHPRLHSLARSPSSLQYTTRSQQADSAITHTPSGRSRSPTQPLFATDSQRDRFVASTSNAATPWMKDLEDEEHSLQDAIDAIDAATEGPHGLAQMPTDSLIHTGLGNMSDSQKLKGSRYYQGLAAAATVTVGTGYQTLFEDVSAYSNSEDAKRRNHGAHSENSPAQNDYHLGLLNSGNAYTPDERLGIQAGMSSLDPPQTLRAPPASTRRVRAPSASQGSLSTSSLLDPARYNSVLRGEPVQGRSLPSHNRNASDISPIAFLSLDRLPPLPHSPPANNSLAATQQSRAQKRQATARLRLKAAAIAEVLKHFRSLPIIGLARRVVNARSTGPISDTTLVTELVSMETDPSFSQAEQNFARLAISMHTERTRLCHARTVSEVEAAQAIHEAVRKVDRAYQLGLFEDASRNDRIVQGLGKAINNGSLTQYAPAMIQEMKANKTSRHNKSTYNSGVTPLNIACPPDLNAGGYGSLPPLPPLPSLSFGIGLSHNSSTLPSFSLCGTSGARTGAYPSTAVLPHLGQGSILSSPAFPRPRRSSNSGSLGVLQAAQGPAYIDPGLGTGLPLPRNRRPSTSFGASSFGSIGSLSPLGTNSGLNGSTSFGSSFGNPFPADDGPFSEYQPMNHASTFGRGLLRSRSPSVPNLRAPNTSSSMSSPGQPSGSAFASPQRFPPAPQFGAQPRTLRHVGSQSSLASGGSHIPRSTRY